MINESETLDLKKQVTRGRRADIFMRSETWRDMEAELARRQGEMALGCHWTPSKNMTVDSTALLTAFNSGRSEELEHLQQIWQLWINDGQEAAEKLKAMGIEL